jgi:hypothetical protein
MGALFQDRLTVGRNIRLRLQFSSVVRRWLAGNGVSAEAEESPLLEAVTEKRLMDTVTDWEH